MRTRRPSIPAVTHSWVALCLLTAVAIALTGCDGDGQDEPAADTPDMMMIDEPMPDAGETPDAGESPAAFAVHFHRAEGSYDGWSAVLGGAVDLTVELDGTDDFGGVYPVSLGATGEITVQFTDGDTTLPDEPAVVEVGADSPGVWFFAGDTRAYAAEPPAIPGPDQVAIYYLRDDDAYEGWGVHLWGDVAMETLWMFPPMPGGIDPVFGAWWLVELGADAERVNVIVHRGDEKDPGPDMGWNISELGDMAFLMTGSIDIQPHPVQIPPLSIRGAEAHWLDPQTIAWNIEDEAAATFELRHDPAGGIEAAAGMIMGGEAIALSPADALSDELRDKWPHLRSFRAFTLPEGTDAALLGEQLVAVAYDEGGVALDATAVQTAGAIDAWFAYDGPLGVEFAGQAPTIRLWAPTARAVSLVRFDAELAPLGDAMPMTRGERGVWTIEGADDWYGTYYQYEITVYHPLTGNVETVRTTDPYAVSLSADSRHTHIISLDDPATMPEGWDALVKPELAHPTDVSIYELHVRDFSVFDQSVPAEHRGTYMAFTHTAEGARGEDSDGVAHLRALSEAGLTVLHLLPSFDIATVKERRADRVEIEDPFSRLCMMGAGVPEDLCAAHGDTPIVEVLAGLDPSTPDVQAVYAYMRSLDGFNWGYDPFHYTVPEGSYATEPTGAARILEFRRMVQSLSGLGLRIALDVVYNHTHAAGIGDQSVLDKIVPGYYHRLNVATGQVETSTCCANTASEHAMMERLMVDSVVTWARAYKVDAFRFDLMGHHMKRNMLAVRDAVYALTPDADGVDGSKVYFYGEGWNFGEVASNARGENAIQENMGGTGIGTFNDRLRDAVRGGGPFDSQDDLVINQGFANGLVTDANAHPDQDPEMMRAVMLETTDHLRLGMAGNLKAFRLITGAGAATAGSFLGYNGARAGYADDPQDVVNYVSKHDNQTLFDNNAYKAAPGTSMEDRVRMQLVALATVALGQGIPFFHAGSDILRSKSMERDSYDSGDWYNRLDWTYQTNNWNVGLPREDKDGSNWPVIQQIIADESIAPTAEHITATAAVFQELLQIRYSTPLFRLRTGAEVASRVDFHNTGPEQTPGLIVMSITDGACAGEDLDPAHDAVLVFINSAPEAASFTVEGLTGFALHPVQQASSDAVLQTAAFDEATGAFTVPGRTAAVFVQAQGEEQGEGLPCNAR